MSTNAYHLACYSRVTGRTAKGRTFSARPTGPRSLHCNGCDTKIMIGDAFTWTRDNENGARHGASAKDQAGDAVESDEGNAAADADAETHAPASAAHVPVPVLPLGTLENALATAILPYIEGKIQASVSREQIARIVRECMSPSTRVEVSVNGAPAKDMGVQHKQFPELLQVLSSGVNVWITGPAGTGKTSAVHNAAIALGKPYRYSGSVSDAYALLGYNDAQGRYVRTQCREAYEHGGVFLLDEVDGCDPNAVLAVNAMLANGCAAFPDGMVERHPDCIFVATANTWGAGASAEYVGRNRLDAAFLDRWVAIDWTADEDLERAICGDEKVARRVVEIRTRIAAKGLRVMVTPRASINMAKMLRAGIAWDRAEHMCIRKGMTSEQWSAVS